MTGLGHRSFRLQSRCRNDRRSCNERPGSPCVPVRIPRSQPLVQGSEEDGRLVADRELVEARGDSSVSLEAMGPYSTACRLRWSTGRSAAASRRREPSIWRKRARSALSGRVRRIPRRRRQVRFWREAYALSPGTRWVDTWSIRTEARHADPLPGRVRTAVRPRAARPSPRSPWAFGSARRPGAAWWVPVRADRITPRARLTERRVRRTGGSSPRGAHCRGERSEGSALRRRLHRG